MHLHTGWPLALSLSLAACQFGPNEAPRPKANPSSSAKTQPSTKPSPPSDPQATEKPSSPIPSQSEAPASAPSLPLRLGLALPASLVGQAQGRLAGEGGLVALEGTRLVAGVGGLVISNNSGSLLGNHGGGILANNGASVVSSQKGSGPGEQGGASLLSWRGLTQSEAPVIAFPSDRRFVLWEQLLLIDLADQLLQGYAKAGPQLDVWVPFLLRPTLLPPPQGSPLFNAYIQNAFTQAGALPYTGKLVREGTGLRLWLMRLPMAGALASEGVVALDMLAPLTGSIVTRFAAPPEIRELYGLLGGAMRLELPPEGGIAFRSGDRSRPWAEMSAQSRALVSSRQPFARHRQGFIRLQSSGAAELRMAEAQRTVTGPAPHQGHWGVRFLRAFGFAGPKQEDLGIAFWHRNGEGPPSDDIKLGWWLEEKPLSAPDDQVQAEYLDPAGSPPAAPLPPALQSLLPSWKASDEGLIPRMPSAEERMDLNPELAPEMPPSKLF